MDMYGPPSTSTSSSSSPVPTAVWEQPCFRIDDLLDLTNVDIVDDSDPHHNYPDPPFIPHHHHLHYHDFNNVVDLCVPSDDAAAELEWLSRFVGGEDDSSSFYAGPILPPSTGSSRPEISADDASLNPGRARSKRSRAPTAKPSRAPAEAAPRRCAHCLSEKTPQWRTGPAGPKTLCNACGVRFKSGRLVPEYRPAASPTFVLTKHSNSHRKVMELRRQKELSLLSRHHQRQQEGQPPEQDQLYSHHGFRVC